MEWLLLRAEFQQANALNFVVNRDYTVIDLGVCILLDEKISVLFSKKFYRI